MSNSRMVLEPGKEMETADERTIRLLNEEVDRLQRSIDEGLERERGLQQSVDEGLEREHGLESTVARGTARFDERGTLLNEVNHRAKNSIHGGVASQLADARDR